MTKDSGSERWKYYGVLAAIVVISFIVYLPVLHNGFLLWDDADYINNNPLIYSINLREIFSQNVMGNYHPLTILTLAIEYHFFGLNETGYHAVNLLIHLMNVILVFYAVFILSEKAGVALVASLLFGIHPLHVESVAWVSELKDLLYTFFFLASYILYLKYLEARHKKYYVFAILLFLVSLLSKAMAASLPVVLILTDYFKGRKINIKTLLDKIPFFLLAITFGIVAILAQKSFGATDKVDFAFSQRVLFACYGFTTYLFKLLFPLHLSAFYPYPIQSGENIPLQYFTYLILFIGLVIAVVYSLRFTKKIFFGIGFFALTVFLVLQLFPVGSAIIADRYSYVPSIGIFYLAGEGLIYLWNKKIILIKIILAGAFIIFFSFKTHARCSVWKDDMTLWNDVISQYQNVPVAYNNRGLVFKNEMKNDRALADYSKAIELNPGYIEAYNNRGIVLMEFNRYDEALNDFNKAILLNPDYYKAFYNRGNAFISRKKYDSAYDDYSRVIELNPGFTVAYINRGIVLRNINRYDEAFNDFNRAIELNPGNFKAYYNRGNTFGSVKKYDRALDDYRKAIELKADYAEAYFNKGLAEYYSGKKDDACLDLDMAKRLGYKPADEALLQICNQ